MSGKVSVRLRWLKTAGSRIAHHATDMPIYGDPSVANQMLLGNGRKINYYRDGECKNAAGIKNKLQEHCREFKRRASTDHLEAKGRKLRKDSNVFCDHIISFSADADLNDSDQLDRSALDYIKKFCAESGAKLVGLFRHNDEASLHYQAVTTAYDFDSHKSISGLYQSKKRDASGKTATERLQDLAGDCFEPAGLQRGTPRAKKLAETKEKNPQLDGESDIEYNQRIHKLANVRNRTVADLHKTYEQELTEREANLKTIKNKSQTAQLQKVAEINKGHLMPSRRPAPNNDKGLSR